MMKTNVSISKKRVHYWYYYVLLGVSFLASGHVYSVTRGNLCSYILIVALFAILFKRIINKSTTIDLRLTIVPVFIFIIFLFDMTMNAVFNYNIFYSLRFFAVLLFSYVFTSEMSFNMFRTLYVRCMTAISAIALIGYVVGSFTGYYYNLPTLTNVNGISYYDGIIFFGMNDYSRGRNLGIFWEPGIFAMFIALAILFLLFEKKKLNGLQIAILMLTLFSTLSTTGYFLIAICLIGLVYMRKKRGVIGVILMLFSAVFIMFALINSTAIFKILLDTFPRVFTKLIDDSASTTQRIDSLKYNLAIFLKSPIFGSGIIRTNLLFSEMTRGSQTSTMTLYFAQFGLLGVVYIVSHFVAVIKYSNWTKPMCVLFCIAWALLLNVEIVTFFPLIYIISFYFIREGLFKQRSMEKEV